MKINKKLKTFLEESNVKVSIYEDDVELENYTDAGGDKIITLDNLEVKDLEEYLNTYDINEEVLLWWKDGADGKRTPFENTSKMRRSGSTIGRHLWRGLRARNAPRQSTMPPASHWCFALI